MGSIKNDDGKNHIWREHWKRFSSPRCLLKENTGVATLSSSNKESFTSVSTPALSVPRQQVHSWCLVTSKIKIIVGCHISKEFLYQKKKRKRKKQVFGNSCISVNHPYVSFNTCSVVHSFLFCLKDTKIKDLRQVKSQHEVNETLKNPPKKNSRKLETWFVTMYGSWAGVFLFEV